MACETRDCKKPAEYRFTWPGRDEQRACSDCAARAITVAKATGFELQVLRCDADDDAPLRLRIQLRTEDERAILTALGALGPLYPSTENEAAVRAVQYAVASIIDGVKRPGSWERGLVVQLFGQERVTEAEKHIPEEYKGPPYRTR